MTKIGIANDTAIIRQGDGPNHAELAINDTRARVSGGLGLATRLSFGGSRVYLGAGIHASVSANHTPQPYTPPADAYRARYADRISLPEAAALAERLRIDSNNSYDLKSIPIADISDMLIRYPAFLKPKDYEILSKAVEGQRPAVENLEAARLVLRDSFAGDPVLSTMPELESLRTALQRPVSTVSLSRLTIRDMEAGITRALEGGDAGVVAAASDATRSIDHGLQVLGALLGEQAVDIRLSESQKQLVLEAFRRTAAELPKLQQKLDEVPSVAQVRNFYDDTAKITQWAPVLDVGAYALAAHESAPGILGNGRLRTVVGAMVEQGRHADMDNLFAVRTGDDDSKVKLVASKVSSQLAFAGIGQDAYSAMPTIAAQRLSITPSQEAHSIGAHVVVTREKESLLGAVLGDRTVAELAGKYTQNLGKGDYGYVEAAVSCPVTPEKSPCTKILRAGRTF